MLCSSFVFLRRREIVVVIISAAVVAAGGHVIIISIMITATIAAAAGAGASAAGCRRIIKPGVGHANAGCVLSFGVHCEMRPLTAECYSGAFFIQIQFNARCDFK